LYKADGGRVVANGLRNTTILLTLLLFSGGLPQSAHASRPTALPATEQLLADAAYYPALLGKIRAAEKSIDMVMYLWKMAGDGGGKPAELAKALGEARKRGVAVRVILENSGYDDNLNRANRETAELLQREGISPFFDSPAVTTHTKLAVIDRRFCFVGSHNLTQSALERNHEISLLLDSPPLAGELSNYVEILLKSR